MDHRQFGDTGIKVSPLCLGTLTFGREVEEDDAHRILGAYLDAGGNFVDTANVYNGGDAERIVGRWLATRRRDEVVVATKVRFATGPGPNDEGLSRRHLVPAVEASLRRLGTDHIDLLQVHSWDAMTPPEETWSTLHNLVETGKVRYLGVSNHTGWQLQHVTDLNCHRGWTPVTSLQAQYSLLCRTTEWELLPVAARERLAVLAWAPLGGGWLTSQVQPGMSRPPSQSRVSRAHGPVPEAWSRRDRPATWRVVEALAGLAGEMNRSPAQIALRWLLDGPQLPVIPIIGVDAIDHLQDNLAALDFQLSSSSLQRLDAASATEPVYPYDFIERPDHQR